MIGEAGVIFTLVHSNYVDVVVAGVTTHHDKPGIMVNCGDRSTVFGNGRGMCIIVHQRYI